MIKLNLGSGAHLKKGFINVDKFMTEEQIRGKKGVFKNSIVEKGAKFVQSDIIKMPFPDNYADYVEMNQVIEHFPIRATVTYMKEVYRVMKKGAKLNITCPSFSGVAASWLEMIANPPFNPIEYIDIAEVIYGNQMGDGESHKCPFTPEFVNYILTAAGFKQGKIFIARKGSKISLVKWLTPIKSIHSKDAVFRNDNLIVEAVK
jgi:predicted SAM-dependent methyltransferase